MNFRIGFGPISIRVKPYQLLIVAGLLGTYAAALQTALFPLPTWNFLKSLGL